MMRRITTIELTTFRQPKMRTTRGIAKMGRKAAWSRGHARPCSVMLGHACAGHTIVLLWGAANCLNADRNLRPGLREIARPSSRKNVKDSMGAFRERL